MTYGFNLDHIIEEPKRKLLRLKGDLVAVDAAVEEEMPSTRTQTPSGSIKYQCHRWITASPYRALFPELNSHLPYLEVLIRRTADPQITFIKIEPRNSGFFRSLEIVSLAREIESQFNELKSRGLYYGSSCYGYGLSREVFDLENKLIDLSPLHYEWIEYRRTVLLQKHTSEGLLEMLQREFEIIENPNGSARPKEQPMSLEQSHEPASASGGLIFKGTFHQLAVAVFQFYKDRRLETEGPMFLPADPARHPERVSAFLAAREVSEIPWLMHDMDSLTIYVHRVLHVQGGPKNSYGLDYVTYGQIDAEELANGALRLHLRPKPNCAEKFERDWSLLREYLAEGGWFQAAGQRGAQVGASVGKAPPGAEPLQAAGQRGAQVGEAAAGTTRKGKPGRPSDPVYDQAMKRIADGTFTEAQASQWIAQEKHTSLGEEQRDQFRSAIRRRKKKTD